MANKRITKAAVDGANAGEKDAYLWDDRVSGFGLKITPTGSKSYVYQYRMGGRGSKVRRYTIGKHGKFTPDQARKIAEQLAAKVAQGEDPQSLKMQGREEARTLAFDAYCQRFHDEYLRHNWKSTHSEALAALERHAVPELKDKPLTQITKKDIGDVLRPLKAMPATEKNTFATLRKLFNWAVNEGDVEVSPIAGMKAPAGPIERDRVLSDEELKLVWQATFKLGYPYGPYIRSLILTGQRLGETGRVAWSALNRGDGMWTLKGVQTKNGKPHTVPLVGLMLEELDQIAEEQHGKDEAEWPKRGPVFTTTGDKPINGFSKIKARLDKFVDELNQAQDEPIVIDHWTFHDLRRTLATGMQRLDVRFEVTEAILNHVGASKSGVAGVYQRHEWKTEKIAALSAWSAHIAALVSGEGEDDNVVPLRRA
ncbi:integrase family protein [Qipengyuania sp. XHP0207]|uniref:tyrosine-type recombinase/integrase n=1 Tax=Qipengyuania sp. XHP0207 TaxID=3038078 RepID=UPI00241F5308|nr:integrase family protein [Qipengyuania sp. XHP0207]MDG5748559.1 integrase family protein [Qipengyuania sp. XHP0207]